MNMTITKAVKPEVWVKLMDDEGSLISPKLWAAGRKIHWRVPKANRIGDVEYAIYNICHQLNDYQYFSFHHHKHQLLNYGIYYLDLVHRTDNLKLHHLYMQYLNLQIQFDNYRIFVYHFVDNL